MGIHNRSINTYIASIFGNGKGEKAIFSNEKEYKIPIYQRPYSWEEKQITEFLKSIMSDLTEGKDVFFGTVQFDSFNNNGSVLSDIVDGQQRLTTIILFMKLLKGLINENIDERISFKNSSDVYENQMQDVMKYDTNMIKEIADSTLPRNKNGYDISNIENKYEANLRLLSSMLKSHFDDEFNEKFKTFDDFVKKTYDYLIEHLYFVVLETKANMSLSEIVRIFNTINTTGMDLNASDLFKLKFYDYHCNKSGNKQNKEEIMKEINNCYELLLSNNIKYNINIEMIFVLDVYKHAICAKRGLKFNSIKQSNETFFENTLKDDFDDEILSIDSFKELINTVFELYIFSQDKNNNTIDSLSEAIINETRYSRYHTIPYVYAFLNLSKTSNSDKKLELYKTSMKIAASISKYFVVNSVLYDKVINPVQNFICEKIFPLMTKADYDGILDAIKNNLFCNPYDGTDIKENFKSSINNDLKSNNKRAFVICLCSAIIDEIESGMDIDSIRKKFFDWKNNPYDIEHIYAYNLFKDKDNISEFNAIGNLVVLERNINRAVKDKPVCDKINSYREKSNFISVKKICDNYNNLQEWEIDAVKCRAYSETEKIANYLTQEDL